MCQSRAFRDLSRLAIAVLLSSVLCWMPVAATAQNRTPKEDQAKLLAIELKTIRTVCVVPPEMEDGTPAYSEAGELAKVLRDYLNWEASVCDVEYHAGRTFVIHDQERYDAYLQLDRHQNGFMSSDSWQSRSATAVLTPLRRLIVDERYPSIEGRWGYTNNIWNSNELVGIAKKIKKSMRK